MDLHAALYHLATRYGVSKVRVKSGGALNGVLLREGLVDEVHLLVHPTIAGLRPYSGDATGMALSLSEI